MQQDNLNETVPKTQKDSRYYTDFLRNESNKNESIDWRKPQTQIPQENSFFRQMNLKNEFQTQIPSNLKYNDNYFNPMSHLKTEYFLEKKINRTPFNVDLNFFEQKNIQKGAKNIFPNSNIQSEFNHASVEMDLLNRERLRLIEINKKR